MSKTLEKISLFFIDFVTIHITFFLWCRLRLLLGFFSQSSFWGMFYISFFIYAFWLLLFVFFGHYRTWFTRSRTDEFISVAKTITIGVFLIFLVTFDIEKDVDRPITLSRVMIVSYWGLMVFLVGSGRIILRTIRRRLLEVGIGRRRTLIVGWGKRRGSCSTAWLRHRHWDTRSSDLSPRGK